MTNPLLDAHELPPFDSIRTDHVVPAIKQLVDGAEQALSTLLAPGAPVSWGALAEPLEALQDKINQAWSPVSHLNAVVNDEALRKAYEESDTLLTEYYTRYGQNKALYRAYQSLVDSGEYRDFSQAQKQSLLNSVRDFKLSGVALEGDEKREYAELKTRLSSLSTKFANNVLDATNSWYTHVTDPSQLSGLPDFLIESTQNRAQEKGLSGYVLTLDLPVYLTVMTQADSATLRKTMYEAYVMRASNLGAHADQWDNAPLIEEILSLRKREAELLGYANYAEVSLASKMASSPQEVLDFLQGLAEKTKPFAEEELKQLERFALSEFDVETLNAWDIPYYSEKLKLKQYHLSQETLRPFFPIDVVIDGLFRVAKTVFGIDVRRAAAETWHEDVAYFEIFKQEEKLAGFYLDLYARANKRSGAWMADCRTRRLDQGEQQLPVAFLVCNFNPPTETTPSLLTHNEVTTLFHEFGHGLHHMLTKINVAAVSGISGVEWDAVELPSQFMENFCWQPEVLSFLSQHYQTQQALPQDLLDNMIAAKNFQSGMQMLRQIEFALFDLRLHMEYGDEHFVGVQALLDQVRQRVAVVIPPDFNKFQNSFSHIFAGGYAAGYYSYKWAELLSADAFSAFEEEGIFNPDTGGRFLREILEKGGSEDAMTLFRNFRGREPDPQALLRHSGLA